MAQGNPLPGETYLHFKNKQYQIVTVAYHSETMERYVVYQALYGDFKTYIRPYAMFISEVDHEKYPDVKQKYRFQYMGNVAAPREEDSLDRENEKTENAGDNTVSVEKEPADAAGEHRTEKKSAGEGAGKADDKENQSEIPEESQLSPWLDKILDAETFDEKYKIVCDMQNDVTDRLIDDIAVVMDLAIPEGNLRDRYAQLKYCLRTRQKYESGRLR